MKFTIILIISFFSLSSGVYAGLKGNNSTNIITENVQNTSLSKIQGKGDSEEIFCDKYLLYQGMDDIKEEASFVTKRVNNNIKETYYNTIGREEIIDLNKNRKKEEMITSTKLLYDPSFKNIADRLERNCLLYRKLKKENDEQIDTLQKQVIFFSDYYSTYPKELKEAIMPSFNVYLLELTNTLSFYLVWIALLNLIGNIIFYTLGYHNKANLKKEGFGSVSAIKNSILYILVIWTIKIGLLGTILTLVSYEGLSMIKLIFNF